MTTNAKRLPPWLRRPWPASHSFQHTEQTLESLHIETICSHANCPNKGECWGRGTATVTNPTPLRKIGIGMFVTALCFVVPAWVENRIAEGLAPSIGWQFFAYVLLTAGEILASIPVLEFAYTQAPKKLKTFVMSLYLLAISLGNVFSALVNHFIQNADGSSKLPGASYYWFFAGAMLVTLVLYIPVAMLYPVKEYIQDEKA